LRSATANREERVIAQLRQNIEGAATYEAATEASTRATVGRLIEGSVILRRAFESGEAAFVPALYRLGDGRVDLLG
jgi:hypothetical protein